MKILHVMPSVNPKDGGPVEAMKQLSTAVRAHGVEVEIACSDAPDAPWLTNGNFPTIHALGPSSLGVYNYTPRLASWLRANVSRFDAVIINGIWQYNCLATWLAMRNRAIPYYVFTHGMLDPWFKKAYPLKHLKKWLYWPWGVYPVLRDARGVIFTCEEERLLARESFWLYRVKEIVTKYGTASPPDNAEVLKEGFFTRFPETRGKRNIVFMGRLHTMKGCDMLLDALAAVAGQYPSLHLILAGPDQTGWASELKGRAENLGISDRVTWTGMVENAMKWGAYYAAEVFCLPSHRENFGIVVAEALACGKPVLISNKVNIWREIERDGAGFVDQDTTEGTIHNLQKWLALSDTQRQEMTARARPCFVRNFHIDQAAESFLEILSTAP